MDVRLCRIPVCDRHVEPLLALYLREPAFGLQAVLMAVSLLFTLVNSSLAWRYLWPGASVNYPFADDVAFIGYLFALLLFSRSFLALGRNLPGSTLRSGRRLR